MIKAEATATNVAQKLGMIVIGFQTLEHVLSSLLCELLTADKKLGLAVVSEMSFRKKLDALLGLLKLKTSTLQLLAVAEQTVAHASDSEVKRNTCLHSVWIMSDDAAIRHKVTAKRKHGLKMDTSLKGYDELDDAIVHIGLSTERLLGLQESLRNVGLLATTSPENGS